MSENYKVVFTGQVEPGRDVEQVIDRFCEKFKLDRGVAEKVIRAGRPVSLKKGLSLEKAEKYLAVLQQVGILVELDPKPPEPEPEVPTGLELEPLDHGGSDTTEVLERVPGVDYCPKCGSTNMEGGICRDCGIVAAKFISAQSESEGEDLPGPGAQPDQANPYSAPEAELETPMEEELSGPHGVPLLSGLSWIARGWSSLVASPVGWILALIVFEVLSVVIGLIPILGGLVMFLVGPIFMGGFMLGCREQEEGGDFTLGHLFAGFSNDAGQLFLIAILYLVMIVLASLVMFAGMFLFAGGMSVMDPQNMQMATASVGAGMLFFMLFIIIIFIMISMTYIFAPALVAVDGIGAINAMKLSFKGCLRNLLPLIIYAILGVVISVVVIVPIILGAIGLIPIWLLVVLVIGIGLALFPIFTASIYSAYRDIYFS